MEAIKASDYVAAIEEHLEREYGCLHAEDSAQADLFTLVAVEEDRRTRPSVLHLWLASFVLVVLSVVILYWG